MSRKNKKTLCHSIYRQGRVLVYLLLVVSLFVSDNWWWSPRPAVASTMIVLTSQADFEAGTVDTNLDSTTVAGQLTLKMTTTTMDTTKEEFNRGYTPQADMLSKTAITNNSGGEISLSSIKNYTNVTSPAIPYRYASCAYLNTSTNYLYVGTYSGLAVINLMDNTLVKIYTTTSSPALAGAMVNNIFIDPATNYLYVSTNEGLSVINLTNDSLVRTYTNVSSPALISNYVKQSFVDAATNRLYVVSSGSYSTSGGVAIIDLTSNTLVKHYTTTSTPAVASKYSNHAFIDPATNYLYVSTHDGLSVINLTDDSLVKLYSNVSSPAIASKILYHSFIDSATNRLYVSTAGGLSVINLTSSTLVKHYTNTTTPRLGSDQVNHSFIDSATNRLYVSTYLGLSVIDLSGDILVKQYDVSSTPSLANNDVLSTVLNSSANDIYVVTDNGLSVIDLDEVYNSTGVFVSMPFAINATGTKAISWQENKSQGQNIIIKTRLGGSGAFWRNDFDDNVADEFISDWGEWEEPFSTAVESDGTIKISNPTPYLHSDTNYTATFWLDTGMGDDYFPVGSIVRAKVRFNSDRNLGYADSMFDDYFYSFDYFTSDNHTWSYPTFIAENSFSRIAFQLSWQNNTWLAGDNFEIDWITIEAPDSEWGDWSAACTDSVGCELADTTGQSWAQYQVILTTDNIATTPTVDSVTLYSYATSGTFISRVMDMGKARDAGTLSIDATKPTGTDITYAWRSGPTDTPDDSWSEWQVITGNTLPAYSRYGQIQAVLYSTNRAVSPTISAITLTGGEPQGMVPISFLNGISTLNDNQPATSIPSLSIPEPADILDEQPAILTTTTVATDQPGLLFGPFSRYLSYGDRGVMVKNLQIFLNQSVDTRLAESGVGSFGQETEFFGPLTRQAVIKFQEKYAIEILAPWGLTHGTGFVGKTTTAQINRMLGN